MNFNQAADQAPITEEERAEDMGEGEIDVGCDNPALDWEDIDNIVKTIKDLSQSIKLLDNTEDEMNRDTKEDLYNKIREYIDKL